MIYEMHMYLARPDENENETERTMTYTVAQPL